MSARDESVVAETRDRSGADMRGTSRHWLVPLEIPLVAALAMPLAVFAVIGSFARYTADDFCWAGVLRTQGFFKAQELWYVGYSPRYAFTLAVNLVELAGPAIVPALPLAAILVWVAVLTWTFGQFDLRGWRALALAEAACVSTFVAAPDLPQSLYWQTGMLTYTLPLILATALVGVLRRVWIRRRATAPSLAAAAAITFVAGGLSETYLIPQNVGLTLALILTLAAWRTVRGAAERSLVLHLSAALAGGVLALVAILIAPSTASRVGGSPADLWLASSAAIATAAFGVSRLVRFFPHAIALCVLMPGLVGFAAPRQTPRRWLGAVTAGVLVVVPFCYFPSFYAQNGNPPARSLIVPDAVIAGYLIFSGYVLAGYVRDAWLTRTRPAAVMLAVGIPLVIAALSLTQIAPAAARASERDATDAQIRAARAAGQLDVQVPALPRYLGENFVGPDPTDWFNGCVARFYDLRSIAAAS